MDALRASFLVLVFQDCQACNSFIFYKSAYCTKQHTATSQPRESCIIVRNNILLHLYLVEVALLKSAN